jgi:hypothetical protein
MFVKTEDRHQQAARHHHRGRGQGRFRNKPAV